MVSNELIKEQNVPPKEIAKAIERKKKFIANPRRHSFEPEGQK